MTETVKIILIVGGAVCLGLFMGWLITKIVKADEKAREEARKKLDKDFWGW